MVQNEHAAKTKQGDGTNPLSQLASKPYESGQPAEFGSRAMTDELQAAIAELQGDDTAHVQQAFAEISEMARRDPSECALELSRAVLAKKGSGALRTPRLLTLLGLTRVLVPECLPVCLDLLRALVARDKPPSADAAIGAAAIIARTQPRALLPDVASVKTDPQAAWKLYHNTVQALLLLLSITSEFLQKLPHSPLTDMARWLWCDCARLDLMSLADFAGHLSEKSGIDEQILALMVDLVERVPATADQKRYAGQRLQEAGVGAAAIEQLKSAWRAIRVSPAPDPATVGPPPIVDPEPPPPEPRVDEWLAAFSEGDEHSIEFARTVIDEMFEEWDPPVALAWWVAVTVDALPPPRRWAEIEWALIQLCTMLRRQGKRMAMVPPFVLERWLDTPQLLDFGNTQIALYVLGRQQPGLVVQRYLYRAVAASSEGDVEILLGDMWRAHGGRPVRRPAGGEPLDCVRLRTERISGSAGPAAVRASSRAAGSNRRPDADARHACRRDRGRVRCAQRVAQFAAGGPTAMSTIYVSSTFADLRAHRRALSLAIHRLGHVDIAMEYYLAEDARPLDRCLRDARACDLYVGLFARRYGFCPTGEQRGITELEFRAARAANIDCLCFLLAEDAPWPDEQVERGAGASKLTALRAELVEPYLCGFFSTPDELAAVASAAIVRNLDLARAPFDAQREHRLLKSWRATNTLPAERVRAAQALVNMGSLIP